MFREVNWLASGHREHQWQWGGNVHRVSWHSVSAQPNFLRAKDTWIVQRERALPCMAFHLSVRFKNQSGSWPLLVLRCHNNPLIILQHRLNSCRHSKSWDSSVKTALQVLLEVNDSPSLPDNVFFFNWVSQITGYGFIDLIFFSAYNNMKYVPCK